jgi:hypothetical protein
MDRSLVDFWCRSKFVHIHEHLEFISSSSEPWVTDITVLCTQVHKLMITSISWKFEFYDHDLVKYKMFLSPRRVWRRWFETWQSSHDSVCFRFQCFLFEEPTFEWPAFLESWICQICRRTEIFPQLDNNENSPVSYPQTTDTNVCQKGQSWYMAMLQKFKWIEGLTTWLKKKELGSTSYLLSLVKEIVLLNGSRTAKPSWASTLIC